MAGFVMAQASSRTVRSRALAVAKFSSRPTTFDCIVQLSGSSSQTLRSHAASGSCPRTDKGQGDSQTNRRGSLHRRPQAGNLIEGSRKQKALSADEVERIASVYGNSAVLAVRRRFPVRGGRRLADIEEHGYALTAGRYVGNEEALDEDEPFDERFLASSVGFDAQFREARKLEQEVRAALAEVERGDDRHYTVAQLVSKESLPPQWTQSW